MEGRRGDTRRTYKVDQVSVTAGIVKIYRYLLSIIILLYLYGYYTVRGPRGRLHFPRRIGVDGFKRALRFHLHPAYKSFVRCSHTDFAILRFSLCDIDYE